MNLYFDNAAAMQPDPVLTERLPFLLSRFFSNQESPVADTVPAVRDAEQRICAALCGSVRDQYCVYFVNTGTDAVNAVFQILSLNIGSEIAMSGGEHASIRAAAQRSGAKLNFTGCQRGLILPEHYAAAVTERTVLTAVHCVQAETGLIQNMPPVQERKNSLLLADGIQSTGKLSFDFASVQPDFFTVSGQKLGLPCGAAVLCKNKFRQSFGKLRLTGHSTGRVHPAFCILLADALERWNTLQTERHRHAERLKTLLFNELERKIGGMFEQTVPAEQSSPYIAHILLNRFQGAIITRALAAKGIFTAPGSACDSETKEPSAVLRWMKVPKEKLFNALRISFSPENDEESVARLADELAEILRHY